MNIYRLSKEEILNKKKKFNETNYGLEVYVTSYGLSIISIIFTFVLLIESFLLTFAFPDYFTYVAIWLLIGAMVFFIMLGVISYAIGNSFYLREFRDYIEEEKTIIKGK